GSASTATNIPTGVDRIDAEEAALGSTPVNIAVIDTGSGPHKDLKVARRVDCTIPGCPVGGIDGNGHGTHVAGTIAGQKNGGARGVAPGAAISSVKVLDDTGTGSLSMLIAGLDVVTTW